MLPGTLVLMFVFNSPVENQLAPATYFKNIYHIPDLQTDISNNPQSLG